jgi:O-antigen/teichoic acid export membrane protein
MGERILRMVVALFVGVYVARYLGPAQFGLLSYANSFVGLFVALATLGLDGIVVRELVKTPERRDELLGTAFWLKIGGAILMWITIIAAVPLTNNDIQTNTLIAIIAFTAVFQAFNVIDFNYQAEVKSKYVVHAQLVQLLISSIAKLVLIFIQAPLLWFACVYCLYAVVLAVGLAVMYLHNSGKFGAWQWRWQVVKDLLRDSWPLIFSGVVLMIQARIDQVMLKEMLGSIEVGYYSVAMTMVEATAFVTMVLKNSLFPAIQSAKKQSENYYKNRLLNFYRLNFLLFLVVAIPIFLFSEQLIVFLFGEEYQPAGILLSLLSIRLFFANMGTARGVYLLIENLIKFSFITMVLGTIINIGLNYLWIPYYGSQGAIVATMVSFFVTIFLIDFFYSRTKENVILQIKSILTFYKVNWRT